MISENALYQVLVTSGNVNVLGAGQTLSALANGQIGVFDADSNLSVVAAGAPKAREFYLAVGVGTAGSASQIILKSAGRHIQAQGLRNVTARCYTPAQPQIIDIHDFTAKCDTDYGIKFVLFNQNAYTRYGYNTPYKTFFAHTSCCPSECGVTATTCKNFGAEAAYLMALEINKDPDALMTAKLVDYTDPENPEEVELEDYADWVAAHTDDNDTSTDTTDDIIPSLGIRITTAPSTLQHYGDINLNYENPRGTKVIAALVEGFDCNGTVTTIQDIIYEDGSGYDVQQLEYVAGGWNARPGIYRLSELLGMQVGGSFKKYAVENEKYLLINLNYFNKYYEGRLYETNMDTIVAIPCADTGTRDTFIAVIDAISNLHGMDALADDLAACAACDEANVTGTTAATDGIA